jgi:hypothetical protein
MLRIVQNSKWDFHYVCHLLLAQWVGMKCTQSRGLVSGGTRQEHDRRVELPDSSPAVCHPRIWPASRPGAAENGEARGSKPTPNTPKG